MKVKLYYVPENNGDGSVSVWFFSSKEKLDEYQKKATESSYYEGWGEDCTGSVTVTVDEDGNITGGRHFDSGFNGY